VPSAVAKPTVTVCPLAGARLTVNLAFVFPESPSNTDTSPIESSGSGSSSEIVPTPWLPTIVTLIAFERLMLKVSAASFSRSPLTRTVAV
jgi:hypothetical protein